MHMKGEQLIAADRQAVWAALNDPTVLAQCIPGCQSLERDGDNRFVAAAEVKIGPIGARFRGKVELSDLEPPNGYTISGSGNGGIAGSAKGGAKVHLSDAGNGGTLISYQVDADVSGRMAQLGGPIIDATAKNLAGKFFAKFGEVVGNAANQGELPLQTNNDTPAPLGTVAPATVVTMPAPAPPISQRSIWGWIGALVAALIAGYLLGQIGLAGGAFAAVALALMIAAAAGFEAGRRGSAR